MKHALIPKDPGHGASQVIPCIGTPFWDGLIPLETERGGYLWSTVRGDATVGSPFYATVVSRQMSWTVL